MRIDNTCDYEKTGTFMDGRTRIRCNFALRTGHTGGRGRCV
ncbi:hypothetical protein M068_1378 [Bacteroides fragilis str. J38-1]|nr:hypothetical protein M071_1278 [Bacteroides fragilis str. Ds-233]EXZ89919.1 hypothetical protein M068_1378 [Bacteroides fragilis str. J38-1]EXZ95296.1 hypothetical protein M065_2276 [Bacteroides fragilis str. Korea 419]